MPSPSPLPRRAPASPRSRPRLALVAVGLAMLTLLCSFASSASASTVASSPVATGASTGASTHASTPATDARPLVVIGVGGVQWSQVTPRATPAMWSLLVQGSTATVTVRSVYAATCPVDGWLTVNTGQRAADVKPAGSRNPPPCRTVPEPSATTSTAPSPTAVTVPNWADYARAADASDFAPQLGLLWTQLTRAGICATAVGPGAAIALADSSGHTAAYLPYGSSLQATVSSVVHQCPLTVVDGGALRSQDQLPIGEEPNGVPDATQLAAIDANVGAVLAATPPGATVFLTGLADSSAVPHLRVVAMRGPGYGPGVLYASSTRQLGLVQLTDITPTILAQVGAAIPESLGGSPLVRRAGSPTSVVERRRGLLDYDEAAQAVHGAVPRFFSGLVFAQLVLYGLAALALRQRWTGEKGRLRILHGVRRVAVLFAAVPVSTFLANTVPWWRTSRPILGVTLCVAAFAVTIFLIATLGPWRRHPLGDVSVVAAITLGVLAIDMMTGSRLQLSSLMGLQPVVAGRFYGMGNVTYALFATAGILLATALADPLVRAGRRREAAAIVIAVGVFTVVVDAWPAWGSDFGGPPASIPAFAFLTFAVLGVRLTWRKVALIGLGTLAVVSLVSFLDWLRPPDDQSHLGKFVQTLIDGGAGDVVNASWTRTSTSSSAAICPCSSPSVCCSSSWCCCVPRRWARRPFSAPSIARRSCAPGCSRG